MDLGVQELEAAINDWRDQRPAPGHEYALAPEVSQLATTYALMIFRRATTVNTDTLSADVQQLLRRWRDHTNETTPDA